jgi:isoleucyl-tRNA synthetase
MMRMSAKRTGFQPTDNQVNFPRLEEGILKFWRDHRIYEQTLRQREGCPKYVFYEGPPTANGLPHPGHCLTRAIKDLFPRYKTMRGFYCQRKAGWDTHGLPVEVEVGKELGIHSKEDIEAFGVEPFIHKCQQSVWRYMRQWEQLTERLGFWVKLDEAYVTYHQSYIESVWWSLKNLFDRGLLYQGHKIVWWWAQGGTALSSGEVGQGYKTVMDPSVYVLFPLLDRPNTSLLVWTTTPWTLPNNQFAAVNSEIEYATVYDSELDQHLIFAKDLVEPISQKVKRDLKVVATEFGAQLVGLRYRPPFEFYYHKEGQKTGQRLDGTVQALYWRVVAADFVTTDSGTGAVHEAPAFGEVDFDLLLAEQAQFTPDNGPQMFCAVGSNGKFTDEAPDFSGMWIKDADKPITRALKDKGRLYFQEQYQHEYPFCWRAENDPLMQYPRKSWFIKTTRFKDEMLANNRHINWLPSHIRDGRFGNFLESNVDWALSRERYWGTPLPIWVCDQSGKAEAIGSYAELMSKPGLQGTEVWEQAKASEPNMVDDLKVHKPYIDYLTYDSPFVAGARMQRVTEVIDCWYDSGAMPFAQWGYPHTGVDSFLQQFPADFISEAIDQTRGWFYSQLAISTLLFGNGSQSSATTPSQSVATTPNLGVGLVQSDYPHPFRNCIVLGLMLGEDGQKMSKSKRNYREPQEIFDKYGADALRWYFYANQPPWTAIRYSEQAIKDSIPEFLLRLWNVYSFFVLYAGIDGFAPDIPNAMQLSSQSLTQGEGYRPVSQRGELDRWVLSELNQTIARVIAAMDVYDNFSACGTLSAFVDALSNWYVRRSRDRFWAKDTQSQDKLDAYWTLYEALVTSAKLIAPFTPFMADAIWQNLTRPYRATVPVSVHLCDYPLVRDDVIDVDLSRRMNLLREIASLGLAARANEKLKVRQPLKGVTVILNDDRDCNWLIAHDELLKSELNVLAVNFTTAAGQYVTYQMIPNFKALGPRVGKKMPQVKQAINSLDGTRVLEQLRQCGKYELVVDGQVFDLTSDDLGLRLQANPGFAAAQGPTAVVVLSTDLTPELIRAGYARDINRFIQERRKELALERTDRIRVWVNVPTPDVNAAIEENRDYLLRETLAVEIVLGKPNESVEASVVEVAEVAVEIYVIRAV